MADEPLAAFPRAVHSRDPALAVVSQEVGR
jgi:hypothetical protein